MALPHGTTKVEVSRDEVMLLLEDSKARRIDAGPLVVADGLPAADDAGAVTGARAVHDADPAHASKKRAHHTRLAIPIAIRITLPMICALPCRAS